ncbi:RCC1/BLIP-II [Atractiella rhizophila]|nr:RCC1/BLIP-II [Atractiella rhizophila]
MPANSCARNNMKTSSSRWGRVLICGGTDFAHLGKKTSVAGTSEECPDLLAPHILRTVAEVKIQQICTSHSSNHAVFIDVNGTAFFIGRNTHGQLGYSPTTHPTLSLPILYGDEVPEDLRSQKIKTAATGRSHTILITEKGEAWAAGNGQFGQLGTGSTREVSQWTKVEFPRKSKAKIKEVACGVNFSIFLDTKGNVWTCGSGERGVLGIGKTGEHITGAKTGFLEQTEPLMLKEAFEDKKIVSIATGQQHILALDDTGRVWSWGFGGTVLSDILKQELIPVAGLGRLGMGPSDQQDRLSPTLLPHFRPGKGAAKSIGCGATNSLVIDQRGQFWLFGKWKNTGDGSAGMPWMTPKVVPEFMGANCLDVSSGLCSIFAVMEEDGGMATYALGQGANHGELALGEGQPRSATKPVRVTTLDGIDVLQVACGNATSYFIVRPPPDTPSSKSVPPSKAATPKPVLAVPSVPSTTKTTAKPARKGPDLSGWGFFNDTSDEEETAEPEDPMKRDSSGDNDNHEAKPTTGDLQESRTDSTKWGDVPRWPFVVDVLEVCMVCKGEEDPLLECDKCEQPYHLTCLIPKLNEVPEGEWFCPICLPREETVVKSKSKRKLDSNVYDEGEAANGQLKKVRT